MKFQVFVAIAITLSQFTCAFAHLTSVETYDVMSQVLSLIVTNIMY